MHQVFYRYIHTGESQGTDEHEFYGGSDGQGRLQYRCMAVKVVNMLLIGSLFYKGRFYLNQNTKYLKSYRSIKENYDC